MPSRRERLRILLKLRSQRQLLTIAIAGLTGITLLLAALLIQHRGAPSVVKLGKGIASVDARAVNELAPEGAAIRREPSPRPSPSESPLNPGDASYYGSELAGNRTASGEIFDPQRLTAAHRTLPLGSRVRVTNARNEQSVVVRINDRGPYHGNRVIDLSTAAARAIGLIQSGTGRVRLALLLD